MNEFNQPLSRNYRKNLVTHVDKRLYKMIMTYVTGKYRKSKESEYHTRKDHIVNKDGKKFL
jgi:hypothetical protein